MAKARKAPAKKAKKAPAKKAPKNTGPEVFTIHTTERVTTESGSRAFARVPAGTITVDLSALDDKTAADTRKKLEEL